MKRLRQLIVIGVAAGMLFAVPAAASARTDGTRIDSEPTVTTDVVRQPTLDQIKERAAAAIDRRLVTLKKLTDGVASSEFITARHKTTLIREYASAGLGLTAVGRQIEAAETIDELRALIPAIAEDFRIYLVVVPKSRQVGASDRVADVVDRLGSAADTVGEAIRRGEEAGYDMSEARKWLISALDDIDEARRTGVPVADNVIGLQAADWEEPAASELQEGRRRLDNARVDVRKAKASLEKAKQAIEDALGSDG